MKGPARKKRMRLGHGRSLGEGKTNSPVSRLRISERGATVGIRLLKPNCREVENLRGRGCRGGRAARCTSCFSLLKVSADWKEKSFRPSSTKASRPPLWIEREGIPLGCWREKETSQFGKHRGVHKDWGKHHQTSPLVVMVAESFCHRGALQHGEKRWGSGEGVSDP